uniref:Sushi domain-containing protein n=1 Tax=Loxodonta africana TaxID=9785 RepID=G3UHL3_LOXAF
LEPPPSSRPAPGCSNPLSTLLLFSSLGDCGLPPDIPNAQPPLGGLTRFPEDATITYKCNEGFVKVPGKPDSVVCIKDKWSEVAEFCNRSCDVPTRLVFASLKQPYSKQSYFPAGSTVEYECRLGYEKDQSLSGKLTCLQDFTWSKPAEFCKKKACPDPGKIKNGHVNIPSGILFGSAIFFSCNTGYELVGVTSSYCLLMGKDVGWRDPLPECKVIICTILIHLATMQQQSNSYTISQAQATTCLIGGLLVASNCFYYFKKEVLGKYKTRLRFPKATELPLTAQKPTSENLPATEPLLTAQKPTSENLPATELPLTAQKPTSENILATELPLTAQKPTSENLPATELPLTAQKPTSENLPATEPPLTAQKPTSENILATELPLTPQKKPTSANASATEVPATAQKPPVSNALPRETSPAAQNPNTAKDSAAQATPTAQRASTTKASFTQSLPTTQKSTAIHAPVAKGLQTTQTSVRITAIRGLAVPRATTRFHATSTSKGRGTPPSSGAMILTSGKSGSQTVKRKCHCGMYNPYSWKRILSFNCLSCCCFLYFE